MQRGSDARLSLHRKQKNRLEKAVLMYYGHVSLIADGEERMICGTFFFEENG